MTPDDDRPGNWTCKHCGQEIVWNGATMGGHHTSGRNRMLSRCSPGDSGLEYGYNAEPVGEPCQPPCLGLSKQDCS